MSHTKKHNPKNRRPATLPTAAKGTAIYCPRKRHLIGKLTRSLESGETINVSKVIFEPGQKRNAGEPMACKICGSVYFLQGRLYTQAGWKPNDPQLEPVAHKKT